MVSKKEQRSATIPFQHVHVPFPVVDDANPCVGWVHSSQARTIAIGLITIPFHSFPMQIHVRGGYIVPMQEPGLTTTASRKNPYSLLVALDKLGGAMGYVYLDDGETFNTTE